MRSLFLDALPLPATALALLVAIFLPACGGAPALATTTAKEAPAKAAPPPDPMLEGLKRALADNPNDGVLLSTLAELSAERGERAETLGYLERLAALRWPFALLESSFGELRRDPAFRDVAARIGKNEPVVRRSAPAFTLDELDLVPEGITHDPATDTFYVGSIRHRKIVAVGKDGKARDFVRSAEDDLLSVLGMKVDAARRHLWVATFASKGMKGFSTEMKGMAALFQYDLDKGALLRKIVWKRPGEAHLFNDIALTAAGDVFVTDSEAGSVLALRAGTDTLEEVLPAGSFVYPNGIVLAEGGARLFVAHWRGVAMIDLKSRDVRPLEAPAGVVLAGIDGLALDGRRLVAVQNGLGRARITRYHLDEGLSRVVREEILESGHPLFDGIPTTGVIARGSFYYLANANLRGFDEQGRPKPGENPRPSQVLAVPLGDP
ncbi:SMP-30/gluconolactonase/LRE family protein [Polyangium jinanense]|uniref:SMP-30/Gluconolactonase/LRE-like region domain-containing protein n=1 Tax=Polyangium jinanense TaxID=2829994 RepID=A0A9X4AYS2_9BACT|nr:hypothetical protein [Polyangium jinanense]MDC3960992.1 hypothetical protein [Polyangium jinanense]MDC3987412.1 hypothetical protein [Polyangium jinanense]